MEFKSAAEIQAGIPPRSVPRRGRVRDDLFYRTMYLPGIEGYSHLSELDLPPAEVDALADEIARTLENVSALSHLVLPDLDPEYELVV